MIRRRCFASSSTPHLAKNSNYMFLLFLFHESLNTNVDPLKVNVSHATLAPFRFRGTAPYATTMPFFPHLLIRFLEGLADGIHKDRLDEPLLLLHIRLAGGLAQCHLKFVPAA